MAVTRGFQKRTEFKTIFLVGGFVLWVLNAYILYAFFQLFRETFRVLPGLLEDSLLLVLTPNENYIYNLFCASIASALGFTIAMRFTLQNTLIGADGRSKLQIKKTLNNEGFFTWSFLLMFTKLASLLGSFYLMFGLQYEFNFIEEFPLILLLLPLILFYSVWPDVSRVIQSGKTPWFFKITLIFLSISFCLAFRNFTDFEKINKNLLSQSIEHAYRLKIPKSQSQVPIMQRTFVTDVYLVLDTISNEPVAFINSINKKIDLKDIRNAMEYELESLMSFERNHISVNLHIDERITMGRIKPLIYDLRALQVKRIQYSTIPAYSGYPSNHPSIKYSGIVSMLFPKYYDNSIAIQNDSVQGELPGQMALPEPPPYKKSTRKRLEINVAPGNIKLNNHKIDTSGLRSEVYQFIKKHSPNYEIILISAKGNTYREHIKYLDMIWSTIDQLKNELALDLYSKPFEKLYEDQELEIIRKRIPENVIER